ncbi:MAG: peptidase S10 [Chitinophagaceae bacterium]
MKRIFAAAIFLLIPVFLFAQNTEKPDKEWSAGPLSVTHHQLNVGQASFSYTATAGYMPMKDEHDSLKAKLFFVAYTKDNANAEKRPIIFAFNGGPGSSSVWLHMGALGPERVLMTDDGHSIAPPYKRVANEFTWLDKADIVFIDPMLTGYTRPEGKTKAQDFTGFNSDIEFVGDFIRMYLSRYNRWSSPKLLAGESYGTTRAAGLSNYLQEEHGIYINGIVLISAILNFNAASAGRGNDLPYALQLPTFAATAWYHKKTGPQYSTLAQTVKAAEEFAMGDYLNALMKGDRLDASERTAILNKMHDLTGISKEYLDETNLRLSVGRFNKELLRKEGKTVGRYDSRITGEDFDNAGESYDYDPSYDRTVRGPYTAMFNDYVRRVLQFKSDLPYEILTGKVWPWTLSKNGYLNVAETLRDAMVKNPYLKVWICNGYYDMATPFFTTDYVVHHMFLPKDLQKNIHFTYYQAGHMVYLHKPSLEKLKNDYDRFMEDLLK